MSMKIDTSGLNSIVSDLSAALAAPPNEILDSEVGKVLTKAADNTPAANVSKIRARSEAARFSLQPASLYTPKRRIRRHPVRGRILYDLRRRYPNALWARLSQARARDLKARIKARGLSKKSWADIGDKLGIAVTVPAYARNAIPHTGKTFDDVSGDRESVPGRLTIKIENRQPTVNAIGGDEALQKAIDGRVEFFFTNIKHGVFKQIETIAKKYPGVRVVEW